MLEVSLLHAVDKIMYTVYNYMGKIKTATSMLNIKFDTYRYIITLIKYFLSTIKKADTKTMNIIKFANDYSN